MFLIPQTLTLLNLLCMQLAQTNLLGKSKLKQTNRVKLVLLKLKRLVDMKRQLVTAKLLQVSKENSWLLVYLILTDQLPFKFSVRISRKF